MGFNQNQDDALLLNSLMEEIAAEKSLMQKKRKRFCCNIKGSEKSHNKDIEWLKELKAEKTK